MTKQKISKSCYRAIHQWLIDYFGKADKCENPGCLIKNPKRYEYALIKGEKYEKNRKNFWMLCSNCHCAYDERIKKLTELKFKPVKIIKKGITKIFPSVKEACRVMKINQNSAYNCLGGWSKSAGGFSWVYIKK